jgi:hypothetical protein
MRKRLVFLNLTTLGGCLVLAVAYPLLVSGNIVTGY